MSRELLDSLYGIRSAHASIKYQLEDISSALSRIGNEKLADEIYDLANSLDGLADRAIVKFTEGLDENMRHSADMMNGIVALAMHKVSK